MQGGVKVPRLVSDRRPRGLIGRGWSSEGLDLLPKYSVKESEGRDRIVLFIPYCQ